MRIFLDANVLFSAAKSDGAVRKLLSLLESLGHTLVADSYVSEEARRNLRAKYPLVETVLENLLLNQVTVSAFGARALAVEVDLPEKDRPVLAAAIGLKCEVLLTEDTTHFGAHFAKVIDGTRVLSPRMLAESILPSEGDQI